MTINVSGLFSKTAFEGKVVAITGSGHGIGKATAELLGELGASVMIMDIDADRVASVESLLASRGVDVLGVQVDVSKLEDLTRAVEALKKRWGKLYAWMNNAALNRVAPIDKQDESEFLLCWETNTLAAWRSLKLTLDLFEEQGGAILNVSSILASRTRPGNMAYASSKGALEGLTRAMAVELAERKIRVNCVIPGSVHVQEQAGEVDIHGPDAELDQLSADYYERVGHVSQPWRPGRGPEDVANLAVFMLSQAAPYVTGSSILIDGALNAELKMSFEHSVQEFEEKISPLVYMRAKREVLLAQSDERIAREAQAKTQAQSKNQDQAEIPSAADQTSV